MATTSGPAGSSPVHELNPVTKLVTLVALLLVVFAVPDWRIATLAIALVVIPAALVARCTLRVAKLSAVILLPILSALTIVQGLTFPGGRTIIWQWGIVAVSREGLMFALGVGSRIACLVLASILFLLTTHSGAMLGALTERGMPPKLAYIISATLQLLPSFRERVETISLAQQARGLPVGTGVRGRARMLLPLLAPMVLTLFADAGERATTMEARGFGSTAKRTSLSPVPDSRMQRVARWLILALAIALVALSVFGRAL